MSGGDCPVGVTLTDPTMCGVLNTARTDPLEGPTIIPPTPITDEFMPEKLKRAISECSGTSSCKFIGYDFDSDVATKASASRYVIDTYSTTVENSGVLVSKGKKTSGTVSGVTTDAKTGGSTGTVSYTADNGQTYTFQGRWNFVQTNTASVDVYFDPVDRSRGALRPGDLDLTPPVLVEPPGYELPDFQAASTAPSNLIDRPVVSSVEECAKKCDDETQCTGFNFGGLDTSSICELVKDTTTRAYADGMSGFRKETISRTQTGDGTNPSSTDLTNQGLYCRDAQACNADITQIITENVGATNPIASLSTSDIASCAYCPIRTYATSGNVTTNEIGVSKSNPTPAAAVAELQYSMDGTSATHLTITPGNWYRMSSYKDRNPGGRYEAIFTPVATDVDGLFFKLYFVKDGQIFVSTASIYKQNQTIGKFEGGPRMFQFIPVNYVTDGFILSIDGAQSSLVYYDSYTFSFPSVDGFGNVTYFDSAMPAFWHIEKLGYYPLSNGYNDAIFVISSVSADIAFTQLTSGSVNVRFTEEDDNGNEYRSATVNTFTSPPVFINSRNEKFKLEIINSSLVLRKFADDTMLAWYVELNPSWYGPYLYIYNKPYRQIASALVTLEPIKNPLNKLDDNNPLWTLATIGSDMPDPYAVLNQFRTYDIAPPSTAQIWAYLRRQGCDRNCGSVQNGYAIYKCRGRANAQCDPGMSGWSAANSCGGTHISCRPADDSTDLKENFSFKFRGLLPVSTKVVGGGSATSHDTDSLRIRTIYSLGNSLLTPAESQRYLSIIFPPFVLDRIPGIRLTCLPGLYVKDYVYCDICPGNPQPTATQVWRPDPDNPGSTLCSFDECPTGQIPDALHIMCRNNQCPPGNTVTAANACEECPRMQYPWWATSSATTGPGYYWPDSPIPLNVIWAPNTNIPGTYLCEFSRCQQSGTWAVDNNTRCGGTCPRQRELDTDGTCRQCPLLPSDVRIDQTWDYEMINTPDGSGQIETYKCTLRQCPTGSFTYNYNERYCRSCAVSLNSTTASFTFNAAGFHTQYGYTRQSQFLGDTVGDWTFAQKEAYCVFSECKPGFQNYNSSMKACTQSCYPPASGFTATYSSGCTISACTIVPGGRVVSGGLSATSGQCEATQCIAGYTAWDCKMCATNYAWNGTSACVACPGFSKIESMSAYGLAKTCICPTGYTGSSCDQCDTGYTWNGSACVACIDRNAGMRPYPGPTSTAVIGPASGEPRSCTCGTGYAGTTCQNCAANYLFASAYCVPCFNGGTKTSALAEYVHGATCTCPPGYTGTTCQMCAENYTWTGRACEACTNGGTLESGPAYGAARSCTPVGNCPKNYTWNGKACVECQWGGTIESGPAYGAARSCSCDASRSGSACENCAANYTWYNSACRSCINGGTIKSGPASGPNRSCTCPPAHTGETCGYCAPNYTSDYIPGTCSACTNGGTSPGGFLCTCPTGYTGAVCQLCAQNYTWNGTACVACTNGGTIASGSASGPRSCICPTGYTGSSCENCAANYTWNGSACVACLNGSTAQSAAASGVARSCRCATTGYTGETCGWCATNYVWDGGKCVACLNGGTAQSAAAAGVARSCTCPTGYTGSLCGQRINNACTLM